MCCDLTCPLRMVRSKTFNLYVKIHMLPMLLGHLSVFFGEMSVQIFCPFFGWNVCVFFFIVSYISFLYILEINLLLAPQFANVFSHSVGCFFIFFIVSFAVQKTLSLIRSHLLNITNYWRNANQYYNEVSPHTYQNGHHEKICKQQGCKLLQPLWKWNGSSLKNQLQNII